MAAGAMLSATGAVSHVQFSPTWTKMVMIMMTKMMTMTIMTNDHHDDDDEDQSIDKLMFGFTTQGF